jgi:hypothetical protein
VQEVKAAAPGSEQQPAAVEFVISDDTSIMEAVSDRLSAYKPEPLVRQQPCGQGRPKRQAARGWLFSHALPGSKAWPSTAGVAARLGVCGPAVACHAQHTLLLAPCCLERTLRC